MLRIGDYSSGTSRNYRLDITYVRIHMHIIMALILTDGINTD